MLLHFTGVYLNVWEGWRLWIEDGKALLERLLFLLEPAFSCSKTLLPREWVDFSSVPFSAFISFIRKWTVLCHNPVTLAALFEFDILIYSLRGFVELEASPGKAHTKHPPRELWEGGGGVVKEKRRGKVCASAESTQAKRIVYKE